MDVVVVVVVVLVAGVWVRLVADMRQEHQNQQNQEQLQPQSLYWQMQWVY